ncbi:MAG: DNA-processing protein DprA [candidate division Zixibacteria bacterium]
MINDPRPKLKLSGGNDSRRGASLTRLVESLHCGMSDLGSYSAETHLAALSLFGEISPRLFDHLMSQMGSVETILQAELSDFEEFGDLSESQASAISRAWERLEEADLFLRKMADREIRVIDRFNPLYPNMLWELNDPPIMLFVRGNLLDHDQKSVCLVGSTKASNEGIELTTALGKKFAEAGVQVVSSLRGGIDCAAHLGAGAVDGKSIAILDSGFDTVRSEHLPVAIDIASKGGVMSEYPPDRRDEGDNTCEANRLLAGLSQAVVITELYADSDSCLDLLAFCRQIGKLTFLMIDPKFGALSDEISLTQAVECGAIPIEGMHNVNDIIRSLV